jgi:hypothetical protein
MRAPADHRASQADLISACAVCDTVQERRLGRSLCYIPCTGPPWPVRFYARERCHPT